MFIHVRDFLAINDDIPVAVNNPSTQNFVSKYYRPLKEIGCPWRNSWFQGLGGKVHNMSLKHLVLGSKGMLKEWDVSEDTGASSKRFPLAKSGTV